MHRFRPPFPRPERTAIPRRIAVAFLLLFGVAAGFGATAEVSKEYQIKAAFLYNFTKFVEWPPERFADAAGPLVIGVLGENPFGGELERVLKDRKVNGRGLVVKFIATADEARAVHVLFVPAGEETRLPAAAWRNAPVLAVGESAAFAALGGTIIFTLEAGKVRFEINIAAAEQSRLKLSSQLQKLATVVRRQP